MGLQTENVKTKECSIRQFGPLKFGRTVKQVESEVFTCAGQHCIYNYMHVY